MWFSHEAISSIWNYQLAIGNFIQLFSALLVFMLVLLYTVLICKKRKVKSQFRVSTLDLNIGAQNSCICKEPMDEPNKKGIIDQRQNINTTSKTYIAYYVKWLIILGAIAVLTSIPWEFIRLYQKALAGRASQIIQGAPPECNPESMTLYESFKSLLRSQFSWTHARSPCQDYYYALLVDPLWEVTPVMVLSSVITRCILHPIELTCASLAHSLQLFLSEIPVQWQPFFMLVAMIAAFMLLLMLFGYRLSVPLLLRLEPKSPIHSRAYVKSKSYPEGLASKSDNNGSWKERKYSSLSSTDSGKIVIRSLSSGTSCDSLNNENQSAQALQSKTDSKKFNSQEESNNKNFIHYSSAATASGGFISQAQSFFLRDSWKSAVSRMPDITGMSTLPWAPNGKVEHKELTRTPKLSPTAKMRTSAMDRKLLVTDEPANGVTSLKPRRRHFARKKAKLDTTWTPKCEDTTMSDSE